jgi:hypothetical protein
MGVIKWLKGVFLDIHDEDMIETPVGQSTPALHSGSANSVPVAAPSVSLPMTDEEKELVAVIASCIVGKDKPDAQLHIQSITRIQ